MARKKIRTRSSAFKFEKLDRRGMRFYFKETWPKQRLEAAVIIGHTTGRSVRIWSRVTAPGKYELLLSTSPLEADGGAVEFRADIKHDIAEARKKPTIDCTRVTDVDGLKPETRYYYAIRKEDGDFEIAPDSERSFRTFAAQPERVVFGLFSCHQPFKDGSKRTKPTGNAAMFQEMLAKLQERNADFVIAAGDQIYSDGPDRLNVWKWLRKKSAAKPKHMRDWFRDLYRTYWGDAHMQRLMASYPTYMIWDDHEIMDGWGSRNDRELHKHIRVTSSRTQSNKIVHKLAQAAKDVYFEYQHSHNPPTDSGRYDYHFRCGGCAFYVWDMRGHRDYNRKHQIVLGSDQAERFRLWLTGLRSDPSVRAVFIVSPVPVVHWPCFVANTIDVSGAADDFRDEWEHTSNWTERNLLLYPLFDYSHDMKVPVMFLSGDVHMAGGFVLARRDPELAQARVYQFTSSGVTHGSAKKAYVKLGSKVIRSSGDLGDHAAEQYRYRFQGAFPNQVPVVNGLNFGIVTVDLSEQNARVRFEVFYKTRTGEELSSAAIEVPLPDR